MSTGNTIANSAYARAISGAPANPIKISAGKHHRSKYGAKKVKKVKKMGWFKRKFAQWSREAWETSRSEEVYATDTIRPHDGVNGKSSVRFTIYAAQGGHIIEYYKNDRYKEHDGPELVIVNTGDSLGTAVEHILTLEALKS